MSPTACWNWSNFGVPLNHLQSPTPTFSGHKCRVFVRYNPIKTFHLTIRYSGWDETITISIPQPKTAIFILQSIIEPIADLAFFYLKYLLPLFNVTVVSGFIETSRKSSRVDSPCKGVTILWTSVCPKSCEWISFPNHLNLLVVTLYYGIIHVRMLAGGTSTILWPGCCSPIDALTPSG